MQWIGDVGCELAIDGVKMQLEELIKIIMNIFAETQTYETVVIDIIRKIFKGIVLRYLPG